MRLQSIDQWHASGFAVAVATGRFKIKTRIQFNVLMQFIKLIHLKFASIAAIFLVGLRTKEG